MQSSVIYKRVRAGLEDFSLLLKHLPDEKIKVIVRDADELHIQSGIAFLYELERHRPSPPNVTFEKQVKVGIQKAAEQRDNVADIEVSIAEYPADADELLDKPISDLSPDEVSYLLLSGHDLLGE